MPFHPVEDHGAVGDLSTVALVAIDGTIDFMCFPRFDSPSIFLSLLDNEKGGHFRIAPLLDDAGYRQLYLPETNVLLTRTLSEEGVSELVDFMVPACVDSAHRLIRKVSTIRGEVHYRMCCAPRFNYGAAGWRAEKTAQGVLFHPEDGQPAFLRLRSTAPVEPGTHEVTARFTLRAGESAVFILEDATQEAAQGEQDLPSYAENALAGTVRYWRSWIERSNYRGRWWEMVNRSALALKLLTADAYGSTVASATLGIPERIGGALNWDYRYCWIRDASFVMRTLLRLGYTQEPEAFVRWVSDRCCGQHGGGPLALMYRVDGGQDLEEHELTHLRGYRDSSPVRVGNGAANQLQLDMYGELMAFIDEYDQLDQLISVELWRELAHMIDWLCDHWHEPDDGIWEVRSGRHEFVYSRVMCWVAVDRALRVANRRGFPIDAAKWIRIRDEIYQNVHSVFWNPRRQSFVGRKGADSVDAAMLFMPLVRFISPRDPLWRSTLELIEHELVSDSLVYRYRDKPGEPTEDEIWEGTFCMCSFWYTECLALASETDKARFYFEKMLGYANHLGLYSEELGKRGEHLGNFPQAFTHFALIESAMVLDHALAR